MGICPCVRPMPHLLMRSSEIEKLDPDEIEYLRFLLFDKKVTNAPKLKLEENPLYYKRKSSIEEIVTSNS